MAEAELGRLLGVPADLAINRLVAFGYIDPARLAPPTRVARRLPLSELVHDERW